jgi:hypothetical protein
MQLTLAMTMPGPELMAIVIAIALLIVVAADSAIRATHIHGYKWWYGLIKIAFYFGTFALTLFTAGISAAIASISTFLGMELSRLAQIMDSMGILKGVMNGLGFGRKAEGDTHTAER